MDLMPIYLTNQEKEALQKLTHEHSMSLSDMVHKAIHLYLLSHPQSFSSILQHTQGCLHHQSSPRSEWSERENRIFS